jgi:hypothetical protein
LLNYIQLDIICKPAQWEGRAFDDQVGPDAQLLGP